MHSVPKLSSVDGKPANPAKDNKLGRCWRAGRGNRRTGTRTPRRTRGFVPGWAAGCCCKMGLLSHAPARSRRSLSLNRYAALAVPLEAGLSREKRFPSSRPRQQLQLGAEDAPRCGVNLGVLYFRPVGGCQLKWCKAWLPGAGAPAALEGRPGAGAPAAWRHEQQRRFGRKRVRKTRDGQGRRPARASKLPACTHAPGIPRLLVLR